MKFYEYPGIYIRKHGPSGYVDYTTYKDWLRDEFTFRCVFCLYRERWLQPGSDYFSTEHFLAKSQALGEECIYENLYYCCIGCNTRKGVSRIDPNLSPCVLDYSQHIKINQDGTIQALSKEGKSIVKTFLLDNPKLNKFRYQMIEELNHFELTRKDLFIRRLSFPDDLPDLEKKRAPMNSKPDGIKKSYLKLREANALPLMY
jgi:hypothetical protein